MSFDLTVSLLNPSIVGYILIAFIAHLFIMSIGSLMFFNMIEFLEGKVKLSHAFVIVNLGNFLHYFAPFKAGHLIGRPLVGRFLAKLSIHKTLSATAFEQFLALLWQVAAFPLLLLVLGEGLFFENALIKWIILLVGVVVVGVLAYHYGWFLPHLFKLQKYMPRWIKKIAEKIGVTEELIEDIVKSLPSYLGNKKILTKSLIIIGIQAIVAPVTLWAAMAYFDLSFSYPILFAVFWVSALLGKLSFLPAGLGVKDVTMGGLLVGLGVGGIMAVQIVIIFRLLSLIPPSIIGGSMALFYGNRIRKYKSLVKPAYESGDGKKMEIKHSKEKQAFHVNEQNSQNDSFQ